MTPLPNPTFPERCGLNVVIVIDESGSIDNEEIKLVRQAASQFIDALAGTPSQIGIIIFNIEAQILLPLTSVLESAGATTAKAALNFPRQGRGTNWEAAFDAARTLNGDLVIFITDGNPGGASVILNPLQNGIAAANRVKSDGTRIIAIGIGDGLNIKNLQLISGATENDDYYRANFETLSTQLRAIALRSCGSSITVLKTVKQPDGKAIPAAGWQFAIHLEGANVRELVTTPADGITQADGTVNFRWQSDGAVAATLTATPRDGFLLTDISASSTERGAIATQIIANGVSFPVDLDDIIACQFLSIPVGSHAVVFSQFSDRSAPIRMLEGATISGEIYAFVFPSTGLTGVDFSFGRSDQRPTQIERQAPFDFRGSTGAIAHPFDTRTVDNGTHTLTARLRLADGSDQRISATFTINNPRPLPSDYGLKFSRQANRAAPVFDLAGATVSDIIYAFMLPEQHVERVRYWLNDPQRTGQWQQLENAPPYDFEGGRVNAANPFETRKISNGAHTITAEVLLDDGTEFVFDTSFTVNN